MLVGIIKESKLSKIPDGENFYLKWKELIVIYFGIIDRAGRIYQETEKEVKKTQ